MLNIRNLRFAYPGKARTPLLAVEKLTVPRQEHLLIQGNSGSGKTSLLFLLAGLMRPQQGTIEINGTEITNLGTRAADAFRGTHIGFVFQQPHLMPALTVIQNLLVAPFMAGQGADESHARHLLEKLGLAKFAHRYPAQLSHGQQQRVGVARALVHKPALVLADEPTSALDDTACRSTIELLLATTSQAKAQLVVATHDARIKSRFKNVLNLKGN